MTVRFNAARLYAQYAARIEAAVNETAEAVAADAQKRAPVLTGRLRAEVHAEPAAGGPVFVARVVSPTPYAKYQEFGTRHNRAQPYLRPALAAQRSAYRARLAKAIGK